MKLRFIIYIIIFISGLAMGSFITYTMMKDNAEEISISHSLVVEKIESLGKLEVVKYNMQDIVEYKKMRQWLPNAKTALLISGEIIACVDLAQIKKENITVSGDSITLLLPAPEICHVKVDHSKSRIYDMTYGLWESAQLMDEAYKHAEKELVRQSERIDLDSEAKKNTRAILTPLLNSFGFQKVLIVYENDLTINRLQ